VPASRFGGPGLAPSFRGRLLGESPPIWNFAGVAETERRLKHAGFTDTDVRLTPDSARHEPGAQFESYMATVPLSAYLQRLPEADRAPFVRAVIDRLPEPVVDYVRLEIRARRA
jgi:trans-aconitate 2-methyltransferase